MKRKILKAVILSSMVLGLPLLGTALSGQTLSHYFEFPPRTMGLIRAPFSWWAFVGFCVLIGLCLTPFIVRAAGKPDSPPPFPDRSRPFPWWGWFGLTLATGSWILAWSRFSWIGAFQAHTFTPLWVAYILTANALTFRRTGRCPMVDRPGRFLLLFPASAAFWWYFEYLNRFVQNWQYAGVQFGPLEYFLYATLSFSTVLPAFTSTQQWLLSFPFLRRHYAHFFPMKVYHAGRWRVIALGAAVAGLTGIGIFPQQFFALVWISPLLLLLSLQGLSAETTLLSPLARGDWTGFVSASLAALICGCFWEMWNVYSLAKWTYQVPFVQRFHLFEMPILGYAGYLPFGLICAAISKMVLGDRT